MPVGRGGIPRGVLLILVMMAPFLLLRVTIGSSEGVVGWLRGAVVAAQATAIVWLATRNLAARSRCILAFAAAAVVAAAFGLGLPARPVALAVGGLCHAAAYGCLLAWFVRSLRPGHEPAVTGFARRMRQTMPDSVARYTRGVTIAWCVFFAAQMAGSAGLLVLAPVTVWSSFVTLWNLPLVVAMILAEFGCRLLLFRRQQPTGLIATLTGLRNIRGVSSSGP